jgi:hypothetical protein
MKFDDRDLLSAQSSMAISSDLMGEMMNVHDPA